MTSAPVNVSELQLYRVLQRANLLQYYDTFIAQGGDDVQQLCEAGEEEFLEIMALVGMASKPLHVRRLQKALQEWVTNPAAFQQPVVVASTATAIAAPIPSATVAPVPSYSHNTSHIPTSVCDVKIEKKLDSIISAPTWSPQSGGGVNKSNSQSLSPVGSCASIMDNENSQEGENRRGSPNPTPVLHESQIKAIEDAAERLASTLTYYEPKPHNLKKQLLKEIEAVMALPPENPYRMDEIRKYAAIYGRFDSKRKNEKPMSLHEISVNEAAAQLCKHMPTLLTRREDLFPLARLVVRESGYQYSKGHSRAQNGMGPDATPAKKVKLEPNFQRQHDPGSKNAKMEERLVELNQEFSNIADQQLSLKSRIQDAKVAEQYSTIHTLQAELEALTGRQLMLLQEQSNIIRRQKRSQNYDYFILDNSSNMASGNSSPQSFHEETAYLHVDFSKNDIYPSPPKKNVHRTQQYVNESLYEEGLRIAQQYGMSDFAEELKGMKPEVSENSNDRSEDDNKKSEEQREWEGEIEEDGIMDLCGNKSTSKLNGNIIGQSEDSPVVKEESPEQDKTDVH